MNAIRQLKSVLCDPEGKCCIAGSDEDREIVDRALSALAQPEQEQEQEPVDYKKLAALGWQAVECQICGFSAQAFPKPEQEPVAWLCKLDENGLFGLPTSDKGCKDCFPVYRQRTWVALTSEEIWDEWIEQSIPERNTHNFVAAFARAIEAKLKEVNT